MSNDSALSLGELRRAVEIVARDFEPGVHGMATIEQVVEEWGAIERMACAAKLRCAARAEEVGLDAEGAVANASGVTHSQARKQNRAHKKTRKNKKTAEAFDKGKLSPTQAEAIADAIELNPAAEAPLLALAETGSASDLLSECDRVRRDALDADGTLADKQKAARGFRSWTDTLGMTCISGRFEPVKGARMLAELGRRADQKFRAQVRAKADVDTIEQRYADALTDLFDEAGEAPTGSARKGRRATRTKVYLIASKEAVDRGWLKPGEKCETADGQPIPLRAVDEALAEPTTEVFAIVKDVYEMDKLISFSRYWPARVMDWLIAQGRVCEVPGCGACRGTEKDHTKDFAKGGPTSADNGKWKCHPHHLQKTKGLYDIWYDDNGVKRWDPVPLIPPERRGKPPLRRDTG